MVTLLKKQKTEQKPQGDFEIPNFRNDSRYIAAVQKLDGLRDRLRQIEADIEKIRSTEKTETGIAFQAKRLLSGDPPALSPDKELTRLYADRRITQKAIEIQTKSIDQVKISLCGEIAKSPALVEHAARVFRRTGRIMSELKDALLDEASILQKLRAAGLDRTRGEWHEHRIFEKFNRHYLQNPNNPVDEYLNWNRKYFGDPK